MKSKLISGILAAVIAASACITITSAQEQKQNEAKMDVYMDFWYDVGDSRILYDYGNGDIITVATDAEEFTVPTKISDETVTKLNASAFRSCKNLKTININNNIKTIYTGYSAEMPNSFFSCASLEKINVDENNENYASVDGVLFNKDKTELIAYPAGKKETSYTIPASVKTIGKSAFAHAANLNNIVIPNSVKKIDDYAFYHTSFTEIAIPDTVEEFGQFILTDCSNLTKFDVPSNLNSFSFSRCNNLKVLNLPKSVNEISAPSLSSYNRLEEVNISADNPKFTSIDGIVFTKDTKKIVYYPNGKQQTSYTVPDFVKTIGEYAFYRNVNIVSIVIPDSVKTIEQLAFYYCKNLSSAVMPTSITIAKSAFEGAGLTEFSVPNDAITLESIKGMENLNEITIPASVTTINITDDYLGYAPSTVNDFSTLHNLEKINVDENNPYFTSVDGVLYSKDMTRLIAYPINKAGETYTLPETVKEICGGSFENNKNLSEVVIPNGATAIGVDTFKDSNIKKIDIPESVAEIGMQAFSGCEQLEEVVLSGKISQLKESTFYGCKNLKTITLPDTLTSMEWGPFCGCESLTEVVLPAGLTNISDSAFNGTSSLRKIVIPASVTDIASTSFTGTFSSLTIFCNRGSYAESFAYKNSFSIFYNEYLTIPAIKGGANHTGKLEAADSVVILQKVLNSSYKMPIENAADNYMDYIDVDLDNKITAADSATVMQKVLNNSFKMPIEY